LWLVRLAENYKSFITSIEICYGWWACSGSASPVAAGMLRWLVEKCSEGPHACCLGLVRHNTARCASGYLYALACLSGLTRSQVVAAPLFIIWSFFCVSDLIYNAGYVGRPCSIADSLDVASDLRTFSQQLSITGRFFDSSGNSFFYNYVAYDNLASLDQLVKQTPAPVVLPSNDTVPIGGPLALFNYRVTYSGFRMATSALLIPRNVTCYVRGNGWTVMRLFPVTYNVTNIILW
jgi:hypothetical protein